MCVYVRTCRGWWDTRGDLSVDVCSSSGGYRLKLVCTRAVQLRMVLLFESSNRNCGWDCLWPVNNSSQHQQSRQLAKLASKFLERRSVLSFFLLHFLAFSQSMSVTQETWNLLRLLKALITSSVRSIDSIARGVPSFLQQFYISLTCSI